MPKLDNSTTTAYNGQVYCKWDFDETNKQINKQANELQTTKYNEMNRMHGKKQFSKGKWIEYRTHMDLIFERMDKFWC